MNNIGLITKTIYKKPPRLTKTKKDKEKEKEKEKDLEKEVPSLECIILKTLKHLNTFPTILEHNIPYELLKALIPNTATSNNNNNHQSKCRLKIGAEGNLLLGCHFNLTPYIDMFKHITKEIKPIIMDAVTTQIYYMKHMARATANNAKTAAANQKSRVDDINKSMQKILANQNIDITSTLTIQRIKHLIDKKITNKLKNSKLNSTPTDTVP